MASTLFEQVLENLQRGVRLPLEGEAPLARAASATSIPVTELALLERRVLTQVEAALETFMERVLTHPLLRDRLWNPPESEVHAAHLDPADVLKRFPDPSGTEALSVHAAEALRNPRASAAPSTRRSAAGEPTETLPHIPLGDVQALIDQLL